MTTRPHCLVAPKGAGGLYDRRSQSAKGGVQREAEKEAACGAPHLGEDDNLTNLAVGNFRQGGSGFRIHA